jgi:hypothetical protein
VSLKRAAIAVLGPALLSGLLPGLSAQEAADSQLAAPAVSMLRLEVPQASNPDPRILPPQLFHWVARDSVLPCPDCHPPKRFWPAAGEVMVVEFIPWSVNSIIRGKKWAKVGPDSWSDNLTYPWVWDNNAFKNNQFSHPYHGNLYFNAARTNGYNFWQSAPWAFAGSLVWELGFERWAPAPNDWINTSLGGITLGESLYRLSSLTLDNTATGGERTWREIGATLLDPVRGFNRLVRGEMNDITANPPDWRPSVVQAAVDIGFRHASGTSSLYGPGSKDQVVSEVRLWYGDLVNDLRKAPFSHIDFVAQVASQNRGGALATLRSNGTLAGWSLGQGTTSKHQIGVLMNYEYYSNPAYEYGAQSISAGLISQWKPGRLTTRLEVLPRVIVLGATLSDYYIIQEGRNYDYGPGVGLTARLILSWRGLARIEGAYTNAYINTINGADSEHFEDAFAAEGRVRLLKRLGAGVRYVNYHRISHYVGHPEVTVNSPQLLFFASLAIPAWKADD